MLYDAWPEKHLLFTEGCQEGGPHTGEWAVGERYARSIINDLNRWTVGWIDWNLLLDDTGGPNHAGNLCSAPIPKFVPLPGTFLALYPAWRKTHFVRRHARSAGVLRLCQHRRINCRGGVQPQRCGDCF